jgi:hypothetical protein
MNERIRWALVAVFATAMAWMEAATVVYLRTLVDRIVPHQPDPLPISAGLGEDELVRELATLIMLLAAGWLAGHSSRSRFGYFLVAFGVWDVFYYVFLKIICGWPNSLLDWDILFLLPLPWWGPVIAPVTIAALMVVTGTMLTQFNQIAQSNLPGRWAWISNLIGALLALYVFMADAIRVMEHGSEAVRTLLPAPFNWTLFLIAITLLAAPVADIFVRLAGRKQVMILKTH